MLEVPPIGPAKVVITATEWELAIIEFLGACGCKGSAGYWTQEIPIAGLGMHSTIKKYTQVINAEECEINVTKLGELLRAYFEKRPRHYTLDLVPVDYSTKPSSAH
jgi:hypothetical protein